MAASVTPPARSVATHPAPTVVLSRRDNSDYFTLPRRATITHTRCLPVKVRLEAADSQPLAASANDTFAIQQQQGQLELVKRSKDASNDDASIPPPR